MWLKSSSVQKLPGERRTQIWEVNCGPLSETSLGRQKHGKQKTQWSIISEVSLVEGSLTSGMKLTVLEKRSTQCYRKRGQVPWQSPRKYGTKDDEAPAEVGGGQRGPIRCSFAECRCNMQQWTRLCPSLWRLTKTTVAAGPGCISPWHDVTCWWSWSRKHKGTFALQGHHI